MRKGSREEIDRLVRDVRFPFQTDPPKRESDVPSLLDRQPWSSFPIPERVGYRASGTGHRPLGRLTHDPLKPHTPVST